MPSSTYTVTPVVTYHSSRTSSSSRSSMSSYDPKHNYSYGSSSRSEYRDPISAGQTIEVKSRRNHKNQVVTVSNYHQRSNATGEPTSSYRDASRYASR